MDGGPAIRSFSVVIPVWNGESYLAACLESVLAQTGVEVEVIAVDNASEDGSAEVVRRYPAVRLVQARRNLGFAAACNLGIAAAGGDAVFLLNQDAALHPGCLATLAEALADPAVGVAGCKLLYGDGVTVQHAGGYLEEPHWYGKHYGAGERDAGQWDEARPVTFVTGAAMAIRRDMLDRVGSLDERFYPAYFEDADLCLRVSAAGYRVVYLPRASGLHWESSTAGRFHLPFAYHRSRLRLVLKHYPVEAIVEVFLPAEERQWPYIAATGDGLIMARAYLAAMAAAPALLAARGVGRSETAEVVAGLRRLRERPVRRHLSTLFERNDGGDESDLMRLDARDEGLYGDLEEFRFASRLPLIGGLLSRLRDAWFGVAGRWALRYVMAQQDARNRRYERAMLRLLDLRRTDEQLEEWMCDLEARLVALEGGGRDDGR